MAQFRWLLPQSTTVGKRRISHRFEAIIDLLPATNRRLAVLKTFVDGNDADQPVAVANDAPLPA